MNEPICFEDNTSMNQNGIVNQHQTPQPQPIHNYHERFKCQKGFQKAKDCCTSRNLSEGVTELVSLQPRIKGQHSRRNPSLVESKQCLQWG